jgi:catechol 2,3-dioxygenase-like lactoylglutathione lyase family enzyme
MAFVIRLHHTSVPMPASGHEAARMFYGTVLGMQEIVPPSTLAENSVVWFRAGDGGQEVHVFVDDDGRARSSAQHLCLEVDDIDRLRSHLESNGITIRETTPITNRPRFFVRDPFSNLIELTQITGEYDS